MSAAIVIQCLRCQHVGTLQGVALARWGIPAEAPIAAFAKRLRCSKCGSASIIARRSDRGRAAGTRRHQAR